jgi:lipoate-protein ligase B
VIVEVATPGRVPYERALEWQETRVARRLAGEPDALMLLEHPPVYTLGRGADERHLRAAGAGDARVHRVARGGEVTYHGPGQLVGYPVVDLNAHRPDLHWYIRMLEGVIIDALDALGVGGERVAGRTGVWVDGRRKIASIGVAVRRWVTWHGFAINVGPDVSGFQGITPCGIEGVEMTSVALEGGRHDPSEVLAVVRDRFVEAFGYAAWRPVAAWT